MSRVPESQAGGFSRGLCRDARPRQRRLCLQDPRSGRTQREKNSTASATGSENSKKTMSFPLSILTLPAFGLPETPGDLGRGKDRESGIRGSKAVIGEAIDHFVDLDLCGCAVLVGERVEAFSIGGELSPKRPSSISRSAIPLSKACPNSSTASAPAGPGRIMPGSTGNRTPAIPVFARPSSPIGRTTS
jgi:hypothetical protein